MSPQPVDPTRSLLPAWVPRFNKAIGNRVQGLWAPYLPPWAVVVHTGRRSGTTYRTPVTAFRRGSILAIGLPYGSNAQWVKNVLAAGGGEVVRRGGRAAIARPRVVVGQSEEPLPRIPAWLARRMGVLVCDLEETR